MHMSLDHLISNLRRRYTHPTMGTKLATPQIDAVLIWFSLHIRKCNCFRNLLHFFMCICTLIFILEWWKRYHFWDLFLCTMASSNLIPMQFSQKQHSSISANFRDRFIDGIDCGTVGPHPRNRTRDLIISSQRLTTRPRGWSLWVKLNVSLQQVTVLCDKCNRKQDSMKMISNILLFMCGGCV